MNIPKRDPVTHCVVLACLTLMSGCADPPVMPVAGDLVVSTEKSKDHDDDSSDDDSSDEDRWSKAQWKTIRSLAVKKALKKPESPSNAVADDKDAAELGQALFFEKSHAGPIRASAADNGSNGGLGDECDMGKVACESCHMVGTPMMTDERSNPPDHKTTLGTGPVGRNPPAVINSVYNEYVGLSGARDSLWAVSAFATNAAPMGSSELTVAHMIDGKYRDLYEDIFGSMPSGVSSLPSWGSPGDGGAFDGMTASNQLAVSTIYANYSKALGAYQRRLVSFGSDFDSYVDKKGKSGLTGTQENGLELFIGKAGCIECHNGPFFSDLGFHNIGTSGSAGDTGRYSAIGALNSFPYTSAGAFSDDTTDNKIDGYPGAVVAGVIVAEEAYKGQFRTHTLRGIADSGPYMHHGAMLTLTAAVQHYNTPPAPKVGVLDEDIVPLGLTSTEVDALVAFLESLSGESVDSDLLKDTSRTNTEAVAEGLSGYVASTSNLPSSHACAP